MFYLQKSIGANLDRRLVIIGVILVIVSFFAFSTIIGPSLLPAQNLNNTYVNKIIIAPNSLVYGNINLQNASIIVVKYLSTIPINFYFANQSVSGFFNNFSANLSKISLIEGKGLYIAIENSTYGTTYPYNANFSGYGYNQSLAGEGYTKPSYVYNNTTHNNSVYFPKDNYYLEFYNRNTTHTANVTYTYSEYQLAQLVNQTDQSLTQSSFVPGSLITSFIFLLGVILIIYGILRKREDIQTQEKINQKVEELYKKIDAKHKKIKNRVQIIWISNYLSIYKPY